MVENVTSQIHRETPRVQIDRPEIDEALRHGNIHEKIKELQRTSGVTKADIDNYLKVRCGMLHSQVLQDNYEVYAGHASVGPPTKDDIAVQNTGMQMSQQERQFLREEIAMVQKAEPEIFVGSDGKAKVDFRAALTDTGSGAGSEAENWGDILKGPLDEWKQFMPEFADRMLDAQMFSQLQSKTSELNREVNRIMALVLSGQIDPEYIMIAAAKTVMLQNGTFFSWKGQKVMNKQMNIKEIDESIASKNPSDPNYMKDLQTAQSESRSISTMLQLDMNEMQKYASNIASVLESASSTIKQMGQMRQSEIQAIAAR